MYLENLIQAAGAEDTKTLFTGNTHPIVGRCNTKECKVARYLGLEVVNALWLEESYASWQMLPISHSRYFHFPRRTSLGDVVGRTRLDKTVL